MYGPQEEYATLEPHDTNHENFLGAGSMAAWILGARLRGISGNLDYGEPIGKEFRAQIEAKFFAHYLKDEPGFDLEDTASFQTGSNIWKRYAALSARRSRSRPASSCGRREAELAARPTAAAKTSYVSDPANPVPYRHRPIQPLMATGRSGINWMTEDQRFVTDRKDVAVWKLPVLKKDMIVTGRGGRRYFCVDDGHATTTWW